MKIWGPAIVTPVIAVIIVAALIIGIGELLLALSGGISNGAAVIGAVLIMALIVAVAVLVARRVEPTE